LVIIEGDVNGANFDNRWGKYSEISYETTKIYRKTINNVPVAINNGRVDK